MKNAARTTDRIRTRWRAKGMSGSFRPGLPRRTDHNQSAQVVGQNAESNPRIGPIPTAQATLSPLVLATAQADRRFLPAAPPLLSPEPPLAFMRCPRRTGSSFIRQPNPLHPSLAQQFLVVLGAKLAISGDDVWGTQDSLRMARHARAPQATGF